VPLFIANFQSTASHHSAAGLLRAGLGATSSGIFTPMLATEPHHHMQRHLVLCQPRIRQFLTIGQDAPTENEHLRGEIAIMSGLSAPLVTLANIWHQATRGQGLAPSKGAPAHPPTTQTGFLGTHARTRTHTPWLARAGASQCAGGATEVQRITCVHVSVLSVCVVSSRSFTV
jgi:hypothetical protein